MKILILYLFILRQKWASESMYSILVIEFQFENYFTIKLWISFT